MQPLFITFEGGEGSGKTTQIKLLHQYLADQGKPCMLTREPGGSTGGEAIRQLLLTGSEDRWNPVSEILLFQAARVEHIEKKIKPALARGETVLCDRFLDSTLVYQGLGKGLGMEYVKQLYRMTAGEFLPDITFILDIAPATGLLRTRARAGNETRFENMNMNFHETVRKGFLELSASDASRYIVIDACLSVEAVHNHITKAVLSI